MVIFVFITSYWFEAEQDLVFLVYFSFSPQLFPSQLPISIIADFLLNWHLFFFED